MSQSYFNIRRVSMLLSILWLFTCLQQLTNGQPDCLSTPVQCVNNPLPPDQTMPQFQYIQTFDVSSCVTDNKLQITEISAEVLYQRPGPPEPNPINLKFRMELFIPTSLNTLDKSNKENTIARADSIPYTWPKTFVPPNPPPPLTPKTIVFSNLDITIGCNSKYGFNGHFAIYIYPVGCDHGNDVDCSATFIDENILLPSACDITEADETMFIFQQPAQSLRDLMLPPEQAAIDTKSNNRFRFIDIIYNNDIQCTCDTSIETMNGDCGYDGSANLFLHPPFKIIQTFTTDCFYSQRLTDINIDISYETQAGQEATPQTEIFVLEITDADGIVDSINQPWSPQNMQGMYTDPVPFPLNNPFFIGSCAFAQYNMTLTCAQCDSDAFYQTRPTVSVCPFAMHMKHHPIHGETFKYASFELITDTDSVICPAVKEGCYHSDSYPLCDGDAGIISRYANTQFWQEIIQPNVGNRCNVMRVISLQFTIEKAIASVAQTYVASIWKTRRQDMDINNPSTTVGLFEQIGQNSIEQLVNIANGAKIVIFRWLNPMIIDMDPAKETYFVSITLTNTNDQNMPYNIQGCEAATPPITNHSFWEYNGDTLQYSYLNQYNGATRMQLRYDLDFCCEYKQICTSADQCETDEPTNDPTIDPTIDPTFNPTTYNPTTTIPTTATPTTATPTTAIPTTTNPTSTSPTTANPTTTNPTTSNPTTTSPTTTNPTTTSPTTANPTTSNPTTTIPTTSIPTTSIPTTSIPTTTNPSTANPTTAIPTINLFLTTTSNPTTTNPTTTNPTTTNPTTTNPTTSNPTTSNPTTTNPTTTSPTTTTSNPTSTTSTPTLTTSNPTSPTSNPTSTTSTPTQNTQSPTITTSTPTLATSNPTATTSNPTLTTLSPTLITSNPTIMPLSSPISDDCATYGRIFDWTMPLRDVFVNKIAETNGFRKAFRALIVRVFRLSILDIIDQQKFDWCVQILDVNLDITIDNDDTRRRRRNLLATDVFIEAEFTYDTELETDVFNNENYKSLIDSELDNTFELIFNREASKANYNYMQSTDTIGPVSVGESQALETNNKKNGFRFDIIAIAIVLIIFIALLLIISGYFQSKCSGSDDFRYTAVVLFGIYSWDFFSDIFFAMDVWLEYLSPSAKQQIPTRSYNKSTTSLILYLVFGFSLLFILMPLIKNFYDLIKFQGIWQKHPLHSDRYRSWLDQYANILFFLSFICGSTFGSIELVNSNLFGRRLFCMGLSKLDLREFNQKRLTNVIVGENLPQLIIQIFYASAIEGGITTVTFAAIFSSSLSICAACLDFASKKKLLSADNVNQTLFSVKVASNDDAFNKNISKYKHKTYMLSAEIARIFPLDRNAVEILPIEKFSDHYHDGLVLYFFISTAKYEPKLLYAKLKEGMDINNENNKYNNGSHLAKQIAKAWGFNKKDIMVYDLEFMLKSNETGTFIEIQLAQSITNDTLNTQQIETQNEEKKSQNEINENIEGGAENALPTSTNATNSKMKTNVAYSVANNNNNNENNIEIEMDEDEKSKSDSIARPLITKGGPTLNDDDDDDENIAAPPQPPINNNDDNIAMPMLATPKGPTPNGNNEYIPAAPSPPVTPDQPTEGNTNLIPSTPQ